MRNNLLTYLFICLSATLASCTKTEAPNCQSDTFWAEITIENTSYNTLTPCSEWRLVVDSTSQSIGSEATLGFHFSRVTNRYHLQKGDTSSGTFQFDLFFFAPENLIETTIIGLDTTRTISASNICAILDSNFHRLGSSLQDTVSVVTNITFATNAGYAYESYLLPTNWQVGGYGFQPIQIEGSIGNECYTRFEMNTLLTDTLGTDTLQLSGRFRVPFK
jgi:hypothetical protein